MLNPIYRSFCCEALEENNKCKECGSLYKPMLVGYEPLTIEQIYLISTKDYLKELGNRYHQELLIEDNKIDYGKRMSLVQIKYDIELLKSSLSYYRDLFQNDKCTVGQVTKVFDKLDDKKIKLRRWLKLIGENND